MNNSIESRDWYLYRHVRLDNNLPFYIGIGKGRNYKRAYDSKGRNKLWYEIISKTEYNVEILYEGMNKTEATNKEKEFILIYKRVCDGGILCNLTIGGNGLGGFKMSEESKRKISQKNKNKIITKETIEKIKNTLKNVINEEYRQKSSIGRKGKSITSEHKQKISLANKGKKKSEITKYKMSIWQKGKKLTEEHKKKLSEAKKGKKHTIEWKINMSLLRKGKKGKPQSEITKEKLRQINLGKKQSQETKEKRAMKMRGKKMSDEAKINMSLAAKKREEKKKMLLSM